MYYGARYYDPALARFITADTVYDSGSQGLNRYSYALNNPIRYNDPSGHEATPAYAWETSYGILPYFDKTIDTGNNVADHALAIGAGVLNIGIMAVNAPFNTYGAVEEGYNAGTEAVIGQKGLSGDGLTTDLAILEACGIPLSSIVEQARNSGAYLNTYLKSKFSSKMLKESVTVLRVDETKYSRILIGEGASVEIPIMRTKGGRGKERELFINVAQQERAETFLRRRLKQNKPAEIKEFQVEESFVNWLRENAVLEADVSDFPGRPVRVDLPTPDQYGLKTSDQIQALRDAIIQGTGRTQ